MFDRIAWWSALALIGFGVGFILNPLYVFFERVIVAHWNAMASANIFATSYFIMRVFAGVLLIFLGLPILKIQRDKAKKARRQNEEREAENLRVENEKLKARIAELENTLQRGAESEEITSLRWELGKLRMALEDSENARLGLSDELEVKTLELAHSRQELRDLEAVHGEGSKLRTMWRYVLELEAQGKPDDVIWAALKGDGFSGITADALLYTGKTPNFDAVSKWGQRQKR